MKNEVRKVAIFSGSRAEYGLLSPVIKAVFSNARLRCSLLISGSHTHAKGAISDSKSEIVIDGYPVEAVIKQTTATNDLESTALSIGELVVNIVQELKRIAPDIFVVYADRSETFAATIAASQMGLPIAHIEAGDRTDGGCLDDSVRHAITKLSHLFFTTNEEASDRVRQLGEESWRVHTVGLPSLDLIKAGDYAPVSELQREYGLNKNLPLLIFTQHSVALELDHTSAQIEISLSALEAILAKGVQIFFTAANSDAGGEIINQAIDKFAKKYPEVVTFVPSLGRRRYHGFLNWCVSEETAGGACIGNSSSGLKEAVAFGCPAINIGRRQLGRLSPLNVLHTDHSKDEISSAIQKALFDNDFRKISKECPNPYGIGNAGEKIARILAETDLGLMLQKKFVDIQKK